MEKRAARVVLLAAAGRRRAKEAARDSMVADIVTVLLYEVMAMAA